MAQKKKTAAGKKTTAKKKTAAGKKTPAKRTTKSAARKEIRKGSRMECEVCGITVRVDETCGCADVCDLICCGEQMQPVAG